MKRAASMSLAALAVLAAALGGFALWRVLSGPPPAKQAVLRFKDAAPALGLHRVLRSGSPEKLWILENVGTGCALLDADGDGLLDVYLPNAGTIAERRLVPGPGPALYVQTRGGAFEDRTRAAGLESDAWQSGCAVGDIDNDGDADLFVAAFGKCLLYRNAGGRFEERSEASGIRGERFHLSAAFLDYDRDGILDLYVAGYVRFHLDSPPNGGQPCLEAGVETACGPGYHDPEEDVLYHGLEDGRFEDVSTAMGIARAAGGYGLGVVAQDLDGDGWTDIYVANDTTANQLWRNEDGKRFKDTAIWAGAALSESGQGEAGMGVDIADADGDGKLDVYVTNYALELDSFYRNLGDGAFEHRTHAAGFAAPSYVPLSWGVQFADFDNDGDLDLVIATGHVHPQASRVNPDLTYAQRCLFFRNTGEGRFVEAGLELGSDFAAPRAHRGLAAGDIDNDGDVDVLLSVLDGPPVLLRNEGSDLGNWVSLRLEGRRSNREGIGSRVTLSAGGKEQLREVTRAGSYLSARDPRLHFGLGAAERADRVRVTWPGGATEEIGPLAAGFTYVIVEGSGKAVPVPER